MTTQIRKCLLLAVVSTGCAMGEETPQETDTATSALSTTKFPSSTTILSGSLQSGDFTKLVSNNDQFYVVNSTTANQPRVVDWYGSFTGVSNDLTGLNITYRGKYSRNCSQTISAWKWTNSSWVLMNTSSVGTNELEITNLTPSGNLADYVSGTSGDGELRVRVRCTINNQNFTSSAELMSAVITTPDPPPPVCGDNVCNGNETQATCPADCGTPTTLQGTVRNSAGQPIVTDVEVHIVSNTGALGDMGSFSTDNAGHYTVSGVPNGYRVSIFAGSSEAYQPCGAGGIYDASVGMTQDITLYSDQDLANGVPLPANADVYQHGTVRDGITNAALGGAWLYLDLSEGIPALTTRSAPSGEYWFCHVPPIQLPFFGQGETGQSGIGDVNIRQNTESDIFLN